MTFTVTVLGFPVGSGTATLNGRFTGDSVSADFSGKIQELESL